MPKPCANALELDTTTRASSTIIRPAACGKNGSRRRKPFCRTPARWSSDVRTRRPSKRPSVASRSYSSVCTVASGQHWAIASNVRSAPRITNR
jgi:hypothetical protein